MKTWYMNLTEKRFKVILNTLYLVPMNVGLALYILEVWKPFNYYIAVFMLPALALGILRRNTHPSEFPKMKWTSSMIVAAGILIFCYGLVIMNNY